MTMPWEAVIAALAAAVMHAAWNAGLKGGKDRLLDAALLFTVAGTIGLISTLFAPAMKAEAVLWICVTAALHLPYVYYLARAYELGELSHVYTIARGLLEYETLTGDEIKNLIKGKPPVREFAADVTPRPTPASAVPTAGRGKKAPPEPDTGGMEPQPST